VSLSAHQTGSQFVIVSDTVWQRLSTEQQEALQTAVDETREQNRACIEDDEQTYVDEWTSSGDITIVDDVDREAFRSRALDFFDQNIQGQERELYDAIRSSAPSSGSTDVDAHRAARGVSLIAHSVLDPRRTRGTVRPPRRSRRTAVADGEGVDLNLMRSR